ncbi:amidase [Shimia marina]|uniref:Glutamyl-tRNA(Gln) amidotransferase subunit A n=1 Tax=Shimia marina TaxID=321267 RepID=A0A0P1FC89_9RHOB|nr:amidase [Shimia marina]CUH51048.1 Glutamyl-tRNA(Gln) amidotransferase subunit A [Shimia marina]SFD59456.1 aspartyl-tRNA(Asn)/glutamyl-tRNA(Gln) amidotransferase subunit A [Shimia marina]
MLNWQEMSAAALGRGIERGEIDPVALTQAYLGAIESHDAKDRIYSAVTKERALAEAQAAAERARADQRLSLLDGVPISWKDLFDSAHVATEAGSELLKGRVPTQDAEVLANATALGLVCLGKTHMSELAFSGLGLNPITATPPCVNDPDAVPGGSSSGAGASVAFGLAAAGIGSDTGGSVRIPAAWNDLVGLKTTAGRISTKGVVPLCRSFDTVGPLTRTVEDAALFLAVLEGGRPVDLRGASLKGARFAVLETMALDQVREAPMAAFERALHRLQDAGATLEFLRADEVVEAMDLAGPLYTVEAYGEWEATIEAAPDKMFDQILERFRAGAGVTGPQFTQAWTKLHALRATWEARIAGYDAVLMPTTPILPPNLERLMTDQEYYVTENLLGLRNTRIGNLMGSAAITLPTGVPSCGLMMLGQAGSEERLLRLAAAAEFLLP